MSELDKSTYIDTPDSATPSQSVPSVKPRKTKTGRVIALFSVLIALGAAGFTAWQYQQNMDARRELKTLRELMSGQQSLNESHSKQLTARFDLLQNEVNAELGKQSDTESMLRQATDQYTTLSGMYAELTKDRSDWLLNEIETTLAIANQQLQLTQDTTATVIALENISKRLTAFDRPYLINLKMAVAHDLETLKAVPQLDLANLTVTINSLQNTIDTLPLSAEAYSPLSNQKPASIKTDSNATLWQRLLTSSKDVLSNVISVKRIDKPEPLLTPDQSFFLRENLKLHLMSMKLSLLRHDRITYANDLATTTLYLQRYFDQQNPAAKAALNALNRLKDVPFAPQMPTLTASLTALQDAVNAQETQNKQALQTFQNRQPATTISAPLAIQVQPNDTSAPPVTFIEPPTQTPTPNITGRAQ